MGISSSWMPAVGKLERMWIGAQEWGLRRMDHIRTRTMAPHLATGLRGERDALFELRRQGYVVVARRWTSSRMRGDVDLIAWDGRWLCFVEVKTRSTRGITPAETAVDEDKRRMLRGLARVYLRTFPEPERKTLPVRFDVVSVYPGGRITEFEIFRAAFGWR
jgi:putative endonuclease